MENKMTSEKSLIVFQDKKIRRLWHDDEWFYSVSDIIAILTDSKDELAYWRKLKQREPQLVTICHGLKLPEKEGNYGTRIQKKRRLFSREPNNEYLDRILLSRRFTYSYTL